MSVKFPYLIAEIGSCFNSFNDCTKAIKISAEIGCSAVKFQCTTWRELYSVDISEEKEEAFNSNFIKRSWIPSLAKRAARNKIDFICTGFSGGTVAEINPHVKHHKISSIEAKDKYLRADILGLSKHTFVSVGAMTVNDIDELLKENNAGMTLMTCTVAYPAHEKGLMNNYWYLRNRYRSSKISVGISCHCTGINHLLESPATDTIDVIEKHFNPLNIKNKPDTGHSISVKKMEQLARWYLMKDCEDIEYKIPDEDTSKDHERAIVATRDIEKGEKINRGDMANKRLLKGPNYEQKRKLYYPSTANFIRILGSKAERNYKKGDAI